LYYIYLRSPFQSDRYEDATPIMCCTRFGWPCCAGVIKEGGIAFDVLKIHRLGREDELQKADVHILIVWDIEVESIGTPISVANRKILFRAQWWVGLVSARFLNTFTIV